MREGEATPLKAGRHMSTRLPWTRLRFAELSLKRSCLKAEHLLDA